MDSLDPLKFNKKVLLMLARCLIVVCVNIAFLFTLERHTNNPYAYFAIGQLCTIITGFVLGATIEKGEEEKNERP
jgi:hypothetical protein